MHVPGQYGSLTKLGYLASAFQNTIPRLNNLQKIIQFESKSGNSAKLLHSVCFICLLFELNVLMQIQ